MSQARPRLTVLAREQVDEIHEASLRILLEQGVRLAFCTDDPTLFDIDLTHELSAARAYLGFTDEELLRCQRWARQALFRTGPPDDPSQSRAC